MSKWRLTAMLGAIALALAPSVATAQEAEEFYRGKQVQIIVGYGPGGGYDLYARLISRHIGRYIPGHPAIGVQNMPGAGSLRAANFIYSVAPKDGTVFGIFARNMALQSLLGGNNAIQFDARKFTWLGSSSSYDDDAYPLWVRKDGPIKSVEELREPGARKLVVGGVGDGIAGNEVPIMLREILGLNIKLVTGFPDADSLSDALERGEIGGRASELSSVKANRPKWVKAGSDIVALVQFGRRSRHPDLPEVPTARELAKDERGRTLVEIAELPYIMARPFAAPPGVPEQQAKELQAAFIAVHSDPDMRAEAQKLKLGLSPVDGQDILALVDRIGKSPRELLDYFKKIQEEGKGG